MSHVITTIRLNVIGPSQLRTNFVISRHKIQTPSVYPSQFCINHPFNRKCFPLSSTRWELDFNHSEFILTFNSYLFINLKYVSFIFACQPLPLSTPIAGGFTHGKLIRIHGSTRHSVDRWFFSLTMHFIIISLLTLYFK